MNSELMSGSPKCDVFESFFELRTRGIVVVGLLNFIPHFKESLNNITISGHRIAVLYRIEKVSPILNILY